MYRLNSIKIANFRSFLTEQTLDFTKTNTTAIYGANASGKSNTAGALDFVQWFIVNSAKAEVVKIPFEPFLLRSDNTAPTSLEIEFLNDEKVLRYGFSFNSDEIISERLVDLSSQKEKVVFSRNYQTIENLSTSKKFGFTENLLNKTRKTTLLVTKAREDNNEYANIIFDFIFHLSVITCGTPELRKFSVDLLNRNPAMKEKVLRFLRNADFWIRDIKIDETDIMTTHGVRDDDSKIVGSAQLSLDTQESAGTRIIFDLSALLVYSIEQKTVLYIDEFGLHLHPDICRYILQQFKTNPDAQLILNTHEDSLMNSLSREDIVFIDKNQAEESFITPLTALSPRANDPFEKHYRKGLYGARPLVNGAN